MAVDREHRIRENVANVLLALQMLCRARGMRQQHQRVAQLGLTSARNLVQLLFNRRGTPGTGERPT
jgi:hypothetical protein